MGQIFNIRASDQGFQLAQRLKGIGAGNLGFRIMKETINDLTDLGLRAAKSKVPVDTGELRDRHIGSTKASNMNLLSSVYVDSTTHFGRSKSPKSADYLAEVLLYGNKKRTKDSYAEDPFTSESAGTGTDKWIEKAQSAFLLNLNSYNRSING